MTAAYDPHADWAREDAEAARIASITSLAMDTDTLVRLRGQFPRVAFVPVTGDPDTLCGECPSGEDVLPAVAVVVYRRNGLTHHTPTCGLCSSIEINYQLAHRATDHVHVRLFTAGASSTTSNATGVAA